MGHIQQCACGIALNAHVLRFSQANQRPQGTGTGDFGLVLFMGCQIGNTSDRIALNLDIRRHHLAYKRSQPSQSNDQHLVIRWALSATINASTTTKEGKGKRTIDGEIPERSTSRPLDFNVGALE